MGVEIDLFEPVSDKKNTDPNDKTGCCKFNISFYKPSGNEPQ
jgi:hypothetical protein